MTAMTNATAAPTPMHMFPVGEFVVVVHTLLYGFAMHTFTHDIRFAFRTAYARRYGISNIMRVIITNIHEQLQNQTGHRALAVGSSVEFDVEVSANTTDAAEALKLQVKGGDAAEASAVLTEFKTELSEIENFVAPTQLAVVTEQAVVALVTGAPTPAPTRAAGGGSSPIGAIVGAVVAVGAIAAVAVLRRSKLGQTNSKAPADDGDIQMADIYATAESGKGDTARDTTSVL